MVQPRLLAVRRHDGALESTTFCDTPFVNV